jgi:hypothetical protein
MGKGKGGFDRKERREHKAGNLNRRWAQMDADGETGRGTELWPQYTPFVRRLICRRPFVGRPAG